MKLRFIFSACLLFLCAFILKAQFPIPSDSATLEVNNIKVRLVNSGTFLDNRSGNVPLVLKDGDTEIPLIAGAGLWMGGFDPGGNLKVAAGTYNLGLNTDYYPGSIPSDGYPVLDSTHSVNYNRFWNANAQDIGLLVADYYDNKIVENRIPQSLLEWPALGNPYFENIHDFFLPHSNPPFNDENGNGRYNPLDGDYPCIKGDEAFWWVFNDSYNHSVTNSPLRLDMGVKATATALDWPNSVFHNTVFFEYILLHKSIESVDSFYVGLWVDPQVGCYSNDKIACIPEENIALAYNEGLDSENCNSGTSYEQTKGILVIKIIDTPLTETGNSQEMSRFTYMTDSLGQNAGKFLPTNEAEYYNYLSGSWRDGSPFQFGGDAYQEGTNTVNFAFDGSPYPDETPWYQEGSGEDSKFLMSTGPYRLNPGAVGRFSFAITWLEGDFDLTKAEDKARIVDSMDVVTAYYQSGSIWEACHYELPENLITPSRPKDQIALYPNPAKGNIRVKLVNSLHKIDQIELFDSTGRKLQHWRNVDERTFQIKKENLASGMYFLRIKLTNGELQSVTGIKL